MFRKNNNSRVAGLPNSPGDSAGKVAPRLNVQLFKCPSQTSHPTVSMLSRRLEPGDGEATLNKALSYYQLTNFIL